MIVLLSWLLGAAVSVAEEGNEVHTHFVRLESHLDSSAFWVGLAILAVAIACLWLIPTKRKAERKR